MRPKLHLAPLVSTTAAQLWQPSDLSNTFGRCKAGMSAGRAFAYGAMPLVFASVCGVVAAPRAAAEPSLRALTAQLQETITGLGTVELEYEYVHGPEGKLKKNRCQWVADGRKRLLVTYPGDLPQGWESFDGRFGYRATWDPEQPGFMRNVAKFDTLPIATTAYTPEYWLGLRLSRELDDGLVALLGRKESKLAGDDTWNGLATHRVDLGVHPKRSGPWRWTATLCPGRDGLPVEITSEAAETHPKFEELRDRRGTVRFAVDEFRLVRDETLARDRWIPWVMRLDIGRTRHLLHVDSARINHEVPKATFVPAPMPGTTLINRSSTGAQTVAVHRPREAVARQAGILAKAVAPPTTASSAVAQQPSADGIFAALRWLGASAVLVAALLFVWRSSSGA